MPKIGGKRKKTRTHKDLEENPIEPGKTPKSFIFKRGKAFPLIKEIVKDMREVMYPFTAIKFQESDKVKIKDYLKAASAYEISHFIVFTSTEKNNYMRLVKLPEGPTITFKILKYSTRKDIANSDEKAKTFSRNFSAPLLILNGFNEKNLIKNGGLEEGDNNPTSSNYSVLVLMLQSMFPSLNIANTHLNSLQRVALFNLDSSNDIIYFRHYHIKKVPSNIDNNIKKVLDTKKIPNLSRFNDISDYILRNKGKNGTVKEKVKEKTPENNEDEVKTEEKTQYSIKLFEIGPRLKLKLFKIEEGLLKGNVVFHRIFKKDVETIRTQNNKLKLKMKEKEQRRLQQQRRVNEKMQNEPEKQKKNKLKILKKITKINEEKPTQPTKNLKELEEFV